jgi:hypothetical protein
LHFMGPPGSERNMAMRTLLINVICVCGILSGCWARVEHHEHAALWPSHRSDLARQTLTETNARSMVPEAVTQKEELPARATQSQPELPKPEKGLSINQNKAAGTVAAEQAPASLAQDDSDRAPHKTAPRRVKVKFVLADK